MDELINLLKDMGLRDYLIKAYMDILKSKEPSTAYEIAKSSGLPLSKIYEILNELMKKGLIYLVPGKFKKFMACEAKTSLKNMLLSQLESINDLSSRIDDLKLPTIKQEKIMIFRGKERMAVFEDDLKNAKIYSYSFFQNIPQLNHPLKELIKNKIKKGIDIKGIISLNEKNKLLCNEWNKIFPNIYKVKNLLENSRMGVIDDEIVRFTLIENNEPLMIRIHDSDLAILFKKVFINEWDEV
ncbi:MAG: helix-turn-helix domain-containing protein [Candidatus Nanoarchaeia archaeon]|jgi:sugar-specific transcriptional regulator TrmB